MTHALKQIIVSAVAVDPECQIIDCNNVWFLEIDILSSCIQGISGANLPSLEATGACAHFK